MPLVRPLPHRSTPEEEGDVVCQHPSSRRSCWSDLSGWDSSRGAPPRDSSMAMSLPSSDGGAPCQLSAREVYPHGVGQMRGVFRIRPSTRNYVLAAPSPQGPRSVVAHGSAPSLPPSHAGVLGARHESLALPGELLSGFLGCARAPAQLTTTRLELSRQLPLLDPAHPTLVSRP